ncbi:MAG TPA: TVP38/TMEM64 family protein [Vicinamibacterales bacterium]|nr:TVP38/TMEM64 family protein [Vicinamibacterales bacterium]
MAVGVLLWWVGRSLAPRLLGIVAHIQSLGPAAPIAFILIYAFAVVALIPASLLTIAGGAVFGLVRGVIFSLIGATLGSTVAFLLGRYVARRLVARRLAAMPRFQAIEKAVSARGRRIVFLLRLSPVIQFNFLNYALGLTTISAWDFVAASLGTIPGAFVYTYAGMVTGEALALAGKAQVPKNASYYAVLVAGLVATVAATTVVTRTARRALQDV